MPELVAEDVWWIDLGHVNAYVIDHDEGPVLVDAGLPSSPDEIHAALRELGFDPLDLHAVVVTHTDLDHVGGLAELVDGTDARVFLSEIAALLLTGETELPWLNTKGLFQRVTGYFVDPPATERITTVPDGGEVLGLEAIATPGHGLGHMSFAREDGVVFVGDLVRLEGEPTIAPSVVNYDTDQARESLATLLERVPSLQTALAGHGEPLTERARERLQAVLGPG